MKINMEKTRETISLYKDGIKFSIIMRIVVKIKKNKIITGNRPHYLIHLYVAVSQFKHPDFEIII